MPTPGDIDRDALLAEQRAYYRARAGEYDEWWQRLSHVPPECFEEFWAMVGEALRPDGRAFLIDSLRETTSGARDHQQPGAGLQQRRLNDGRTFRIVKLFYEPDSLAARLRRLGWRAQMQRTEHYFIHGSASRG